MPPVRAPGSGGEGRRGAARWVLSLVVVLILIGFGFVFGVGLGILSVGPDLIVDHGRGRTEEVPWSVDAPTSIQGLTQPDAIAEEITGGGSDATESRKSLLSIAAPAKSGFAVQVGAFSDPGKAEALVRKLRAENLAVYRIPSSDSGDDRWRVRVGPVRSRAQADALAGRLKRELDLPTWVLSDGGTRDDALSGHR